MKGLLHLNSHKTPKKPHWFLQFTDFVISHSKILSHKSKLDIVHIRKKKKRLRLLRMDKWGDRLNIHNERFLDGCTLLL